MIIDNVPGVGRTSRLHHNIGCDASKERRTTGEARGPGYQLLAKHEARLH